MSRVESRVEGGRSRVENAEQSRPSTLPPLPYLYLSIALIALLASAASLVNGFVYDDGPIVATNPRVHTLARWWEMFLQPYWPAGWGDANYRPVTILSFAAQWALGGGSPVLFHATNVALYLAACLAVLRLAAVILPATAAWVAAALFAAHPVHVEAVGNVVGQAEIVVALCSTLAVAGYLKARSAGYEPRGVGRSAAPVAVLYAIACFSKETGFFLPGLLLAAELTVVGAHLSPERRRVAARLRETFPVYGACAAIGGLYFAMRVAALDGVGDDPNPVVALLGPEARLLTMLGVVPEWARLLVWPARLAADYSPREVSLFSDFEPALIPATGIVVGTVVVGVAGWYRSRLVTFAALWIAVALFPVSNVLVRSGVILAERTLFLPSVGVALAAGAAAAWITARATTRRAWWGPLAALPVAALLVAGVTKSASRQRVWRSNDDFFLRIVEDAPLGYRAHYMHGMWLFEKGRLPEGERHVRAAIALFPYDAAPYTDLADRYRKSGLCAPARQLYRQALDVGSARARTRLGLIACLLHDGEVAEARAEALRGLSLGGPEAQRFREALGIVDSVTHATTRTARPAKSGKVTLSGTPRTAAKGTGARN